MHLFNVFSFQFDPLSLFFLLVTICVSVPALIYSCGYLKGQYSRLRIVLATVAVLLFVLSMAAVVCAANLLFFLFAWELMSLISYFLVVFDHEHHGSLDAGLIYLLMTHIGTAFLIAAFFIMHSYAGSFDLGAIRDSMAAVPAGVKGLLFAFLLVGFGTKAGIVPLHVWLPLAHPQAPSHVSSIMSGVMIKVALYGFLRMVPGLIGVNSVWWGITVMILAAATCLVGIMYALLERDIKKILAYSSVENVGIILLAVGAAMVLIVRQRLDLASLVCAGGLFHLINHAVFKGLLFLGAGSVYKATGTRDLEDLGGLIRLMPWTAGFFLIGSIAIAALPPLNGFVSEWLIFQGLFSAGLALPVGFKVFFVFMMVCLAVTSGLAAACFVRLFGIGFLGMPRSSRAAAAVEAPLSMKLGMGMLAAGIPALALGAGQAWQLIQEVAATVVGAAGAQPSAGISIAGSVLNIPLIAGIFAAVLGSVYLLVRLCAGPARVRRSQTWDCGYYSLGPRNEYTATAFSKPFRVAFSFFYLPQRKVEKLRESYYHVSSFKYEVQTIPVFKEYFYAPLVKGFFKVAGRMKGLQMGSVHWYLGYILAMFLAVMFFVLVR